MIIFYLILTLFMIFRMALTHSHTDKQTSRLVVLIGQGACWVKKKSNTMIALRLPPRLLLPTPLPPPRLPLLTWRLPEPSVLAEAAEAPEALACLWWWWWWMMVAVMVVMVIDDNDDDDACLPALPRKSPCSWRLAWLPQEDLIQSRMIQIASELKIGFSTIEYWETEEWNLKETCQKVSSFHMT